MSREFYYNRMLNTPNDGCGMDYTLESYNQKLAAERKPGFQIRKAFALQDPYEKYGFLPGALEAYYSLVDASDEKVILPQSENHSESAEEQSLEAIFLDDIKSMFDECGTNLPDYLHSNLLSAQDPKRILDVELDTKNLEGGCITLVVRSDGYITKSSLFALPKDNEEASHRLIVFSGVEKELVLKSWKNHVVSKPVTVEGKPAFKPEAIKSAERKLPHLTRLLLLL